MLTRSRTRLKRPRGFISEISHPHEGVTRNDLDCQSSINDDKSTLSTMPSMMGPSSQDTAHLLLHSEKNVQEIVRLFEKEDEEIRHLNDDIKKQQKKLNTLEAHKRRRIEDFRAQLREEKMRLFRERLQNVEDLHQRLKDLQQLASDLELSAIQECPVCYEIIFLASAANGGGSAAVLGELVNAKLPRTMMAKVMACAHALCVSCFFKCARPCEDVEENDHFHVFCPVCRGNQAIFFDDLPAEDSW